MKEEEPCKIQVSIPEGANLHDLEKAIEEALKTNLTTSFLNCEEITIILNRHSKPTA